MPDYSVKQYIPQSKFWIKNKEDEPYTGFVEGLGYAMVENITIRSQKHINGDIWYNTLPVQRIDYSPEARVRSLNITEEHIRKAITSRNIDGTYTVNMGNKASEQFLILSSLNDLVIEIKDICNTLTLHVKATSYKNGNIITEEYSIPLRDFSEQYRNIESEILQAVDNANSVIGTPIGWLESKWEIKSNANYRFKNKLANEINVALRHNGYKTVASTLRDKTLPKILKWSSRGGNIIGGATIGINVLLNGKIKTSDLFLSVIFGTSFIPGVGWAIGGVFFAADVISLIISDKSIGDHIDDISNGWSYEFRKTGPEVRDLEYYAPKRMDLDIDSNLREMVMPQDNTRVYLPPNYRY